MEHKAAKTVLSQIICLVLVKVLAKSTNSQTPFMGIRNKQHLNTVNIRSQPYQSKTSDTGLTALTSSTCTITGTGEGVMFHSVSLPQTISLFHMCYSHFQYRRMSWEYATSQMEGGTQHSTDQRDFTNKIVKPVSTASLVQSKDEQCRLRLTCP